MIWVCVVMEQVCSNVSGCSDCVGAAMCDGVCVAIMVWVCVVM